MKHSLLASNTFPQFHGFHIGWSLKYENMNVVINLRKKKHLKVFKCINQM